MKKFIRFLKSIPYFCLALTIILCSLMMAIPASAAGPLVGSSDSYYGVLDYPSLKLPSGFDSSTSKFVLIVSNSNNIAFVIPGQYANIFFSSDGRDLTVSNSTVYFYNGSSWSSSSDMTLSVSRPESAIFYSGNVSFTGTGVISPIESSIGLVQVTKNGALSVFSGVGSWLVGALGNAMQMFYVDGALTFLGYLAVAGLSLSVIFLIIGFVSRFLKFGG